MNRAGRYTEGHYTIKRVNTLPKQGNANWLFALRTPILDKFYRWDVNEKEWEIIEVGGSNFIPEDTNLEFNSYTNELKITFADGTTKTTVINIIRGTTSYQDTTGTEKHKIGEFVNEDNTITEVNETNTDVRLETDSLIYTKEDSTETTIDLSPYKNINSIQAGANITVNNADPLNPIINSVSSGQTLQQTLDNGNTFNSQILGDLTSNIKLSKEITLDYSPNKTSENIIDGSSIEIKGREDLSPVTLDVPISTKISFNGIELEGIDEYNGSYNSGIKKDNIGVGYTSSGNRYSNSLAKTSIISSLSNNLGEHTFSSLSHNSVKINETVAQPLSTTYGRGEIKTNSNGNDFKVVMPYSVLSTSPFKTIEETITFPLKTGTVALTNDIPQIQAGTNIAIDNTDPLNPIVNASGGSGGGINSVVAGTGIFVDNTDTANPIISSTADLTGYVPYIGATNDVDLGNHSIKLGKEVTVANKGVHDVYLYSNDGTDLIRRQKSYWSGSTYVNTNGYGFGTQALQNNTGSISNGFGNSTLQNNTGSSSNGFGYYALRDNSGSSSNGFGHFALYNNSGSSSNGFGGGALENNTGANSNGFGHYALQNNTGSSSNGFGYYALRDNTGANSNGFGHYALQNNTGSNSSGFGYSALRDNTGANSNGFGVNALQNNTGLNSNGFGNISLSSNIGSNSNGFGSSTLMYNDYDNNTAVGHDSFSEFYPDTSNPITFLGSDVDVANDTITINAHGLDSVGKIFNVRAIAPNFLGGLTSTTLNYRFEVIDANTLKSLNNITSKDDGLTYTFHKQITIENTTTIGANSHPTKSNQVVLGDTNVEEVTTSGDFVSTGDGKGLVLTTPDGLNQYRISIDNSGNIISTII